MAPDQLRLVGSLTVGPVITVTPPAPCLSPAQILHDVQRSEAKARSHRSFHQFIGGRRPGRRGRNWE